MILEHRRRALRLAEHGWPVALVEKGLLGGTCVNTGCTPTKTMIHRSVVAHYARQGARWGVETTGVSVSLAGKLHSTAIPSGSR